ncbi:hypothetical protein GQ457_06G011680 [Hibiscus cannabinus]
MWNDAKFISGEMVENGLRDYNKDRKVLNNNHQTIVRECLIISARLMPTLICMLMRKHTYITTSWSFNLGYISVATSGIYGYAIVVSLEFYFLLQYQDSNISLVRFWCMWSYSLFIFIPYVCDPWGKESFEAEGIVMILDGSMGMEENGLEIYLMTETTVYLRMSIGPTDTNLMIDLDTSWRVNHIVTTIKITNCMYS